MKDKLINILFLIYIGWFLSVVIDLFIFKGFWMNTKGYKEYKIYILNEAERTKEFDFIRHIYEDGVIK